MKNEKTLSKRLSKQLFIRIILTICGYILFGIIAYVAALILFNAKAWQGDELLYMVAIWFSMRSELFALLYLFLGCLIIFYYYWKKPFAYFQEVADGTKSVYASDDKLISLSPQLAELETQLNQIKIESQNNQRAAREAEQRKNDLVTYLAHDLKTPITSLIGYLTLLRDEPDISADTRARYVNITLDKAERLDELINEFFEITRFNLSHITLEKQQINLSLMLTQLVYEFQPMFSEKDLKCRLDVPENILLRCDPDKLQRVFDNLLRNAVSYSFSGSVIRIGVQTAENHVTLTFENDGNTISEEKLARLFEQFFRLDTSRSSGSGGAGLGLAIAKEITELHGGTITAWSADDTIRFTVNLPLS